MADNTIYPYGVGGYASSGNGIVNDFTTGGADKALSAERGKQLGGDIYGTEVPETTTLTLEQGGMESNGTLTPSDSSYTSIRIRTASRVPVNGAFTLTFEAGFLYNIFFYETETSALDTQLGVWASGNYDGEYEGYIMIGIRNESNTSISPSDTVVTLTQDFPTPGIKAKVEAMTEDTGSYVWGADLIRRNIHIEKVGQLTYPQAFCVYGGKYYSTDGSHIAEQDATFAKLRDVTISLGHGNALQLGAAGKAWASGWDDQKVYKVDLATLTVTESVTLPTTGYTTVAVNEDAGLMYIFQRNSSPDTVGQYNFITYDYVNEEVISTRKIESFAAMQSVDFYEGKILMLYGLATPTAPSGMKVYGTEGDILASFDIAPFGDEEPEGIMYDRDSGKLLVSDYSKNLYEIRR